MDYISAKELSAIWNISSKRIIVMAKNGQIPGAKLIGNSWVFPSGIEKPKDRRYKENKTETNTEFHFPLLSLRNWDLSLLSDEEKILLEYETRADKLNYDNTYNDFKSLFESTNNTTIKVGCLYYLCIICGITKRYKEALFYYSELTKLVNSDIPYKAELMLLYYDISSYIVNDTNTTETNFDLSTLDSSCAPELFLIASYKSIINYIPTRILPDVKFQEMALLAFNEKEYSLTSIFLHLHLVISYTILKDDEKKIHHAKKAFEIGQKYEYKSPFVIYFAYCADVIDYIKDSIEEKFLNDIIQASNQYLNSLSELKMLATYKKIPVLDNEDFEYMNYLIKGLNTTDVATIKGLSEKTIYSKYKDIREKLNAKNKKELLENFRKYIMTRS